MHPNSDQPPSSTIHIHSLPTKPNENKAKMSTFRINRGPVASATLYFDGSAAPNPGDGGAAAVASIKLHEGTTERTKKQWSIPLGHVTNVAAEYHALILGLRSLLSHFHHLQIRHEYVTLSIRGDSETLINHLNGIYRVRSPLLAPLYLHTLHLASRFQNITFTFIPRTSNLAADKPANAAQPPAQRLFSTQTCSPYSKHGSPVVPPLPRTTSTLPAQTLRVSLMQTSSLACRAVIPSLQICTAPIRCQ